MCDDGHQVVDVVDVVAVAVVKKFPKTKKTKRRNVNKYETAIYSRCHSRVMNMNTNSVFLFYISLTHFASCVYIMNDCGRRLTRVTQIMHELRLRLHDTHTHTLAPYPRRSSETSKHTTISHLLCFCHHIFSFVKCIREYDTYYDLLLLSILLFPQQKKSEEEGKKWIVNAIDERFNCFCFVSLHWNWNIFIGLAFGYARCCVCGEYTVLAVLCARIMDTLPPKWAYANTVSVFFLFNSSL